MNTPPPFQYPLRYLFFLMVLLALGATVLRMAGIDLATALLLASILMVGGGAALAFVYFALRHGEGEDDPGRDDSDRP